MIPLRDEVHQTQEKKTLNLLFLTYYRKPPSCARSFFRPRGGLFNSLYYCCCCVVVRRSRTLLHFLPGTTLSIAGGGGDELDQIVRFCADCKHNVVTAFDILTCKCDLADIENEDEFLPDLFWPFAGRIGPVPGDVTGQKVLLTCPLEVGTCPDNTRLRGQRVLWLFVGYKFRDVVRRTYFSFLLF